MNIEPNILFIVHEGAPFVGDHANDDNLLQKGRPLIMRFHQQHNASLGNDPQQSAKRRNTSGCATAEECHETLTRG